MCSLRWKRIRLIQINAAIGMIAAGFAHAQPQLAVPPEGQPNRVVIEYAKPQNGELQDLYEALKAYGALEKIQKILSPMRLREQLVVKTTECGKVNSWYRREDSVPTVTICYELLKHILESLPRETTREGITADNAKVGQVLWFTLHEVGHATFAMFNVPIFGNEEDAADNFATYVMLQFAEAVPLIKGAAWAWNEYMRDYQRNPVVRVRLANFADEHGLPQQRFYNLVCLALGSNPARFADVVLEGYLPQIRADRCLLEYRRVALAFDKEIRPHIDRNLAKGVTEANWLPDPLPRPETQK
jgi:hypothetical protein